MRSQNAARSWTWIVACFSTTLSPYTYDTVIPEIIQSYFRSYFRGEMFDTVYPAVIYPWKWIPAARHSGSRAATSSTCVFSTLIRSNRYKIYATCSCSCNTADSADTVIPILNSCSTLFNWRIFLQLVNRDCILDYMHMDGQRDQYSSTGFLSEAWYLNHHGQLPWSHGNQSLLLRDQCLTSTEAYQLPAVP